MVAWDLSRRESLEDQRVQAQKIQAVNQLASGVAHDINNNLAVILGYSEFLLGKSLIVDELEREALVAIQEQSVECANTVRRIQLFSRAVPKSQYTSISVNDVVREVVRLTEPVWKHQAEKDGTAIELDMDLGQLPPIYAYVSGLKDALISLIHNAVDALPSGGRILIQTRHEGKAAVIRVQDNGEGVDPSVASRIFDPFFTTKGPSRP